MHLNGSKPKVQKQKFNRIDAEKVSILFHCKSLMLNVKQSTICHNRIQEKTGVLFFSQYFSFNLARHKHY